MRHTPKSMWSLETLGRTRLSRYFFLRDFMHSEISAFHGIPNIPDNPDAVITAGQALAQNLLDPLVETFGPITIRSGYRSALLNKFGNDNKLNCSRNEVNGASRIWERTDPHGNSGACATIVIPWFADQYDQGRDWRDMAYWIHDHLDYHEQYFFPKLAALNLTWRDNPARRVLSYISPKGTLVASGAEPSETLNERRNRYADFPPFRAIKYPPLPALLNRST
ncbi:hypothetical protein GCM10011498_16780 [Amylibacter cionae]|uniref:Peptidase M15 n=2 Tax=Neptunicoccus cionae TaxID=2035344 RepID=A0A916QVR6_9RHOB|nr:hypothetical protein [Amylibacter cionae]GGA16872.1 hypothetical protein GCM10011498_16780 [Amylibacter cionae]